MDNALLMNVITNSCQIQRCCCVSELSCGWYWLPDGQVNTSDVSEGTTIKLTCNAGYYLDTTIVVGNIVTCLNTRLWSSYIPWCQGEVTKGVFSIKYYRCS